MDCVLTTTVMHSPISPISLLPLFAVQGLDDSGGDSVTGFLAEQLRHQCQTDMNREPKFAVSEN